MVMVMVMVMASDYSFFDGFWVLGSGDGDGFW